MINWTINKKIVGVVLATVVVAIVGVRLIENNENIVGQSVEPTAKETSSTSTIESRLDGKNRTEKALIKSEEIVKQQGIEGTYVSSKDSRYSISIESKPELVSTEEGTGVQVFVRATKDGSPVGFGADGTVETERFRFYNPPILIPDENGEVVRTYLTPDGGIIEKRYTENPQEALRQLVAMVTEKFGKDGKDIISGKVGNTVDTFAPTLDGCTCRWGTDATWSGARDATDALSTDTTSAVQYLTSEFRTGPNRYQNTRVFFVYDTSAIPDDSTIDSGYMEVESDTDTINISTWGLQEGTPASEAVLDVGDYDAMTINSPTELATRITPSAVGGTRNTWTLNSSGLAAIDKTGNTVLVLRAGRDIDDSAPVARSYWTGKMTDTSGTVDDPLLSVTHTAPVAINGKIRINNGSIRINNGTIDI